MRRFATWLFIGGPFLISIVVGVVVALLLLLWSACIEGYRIGRTIGKASE